MCADRSWKYDINKSVHILILSLEIEWMINTIDNEIFDIFNLSLFISWPDCTRKTTKIMIHVFAMVHLM